MHFIENCHKWAGWPHGFTKKGCTLCCYIKGRIWFIDKAASHVIGRCESQTGDFGVFMRPLTAGSLLGVPNLSSANTTTAGKKKPCCLFFSTSEFKSWLFLAFLCYCKLLFDTCVSTDARERGSGDSPAIFHPVKLAFETFDKLICLEWSERTIFLFTFLSLSCFSCYHSPGRIGRRSGEACRKRWNALTSGTSLIFTSLCVNSYHECTTEGQSWWSWVSNDPGFTPRLEIHPGMALSCQFTLKWLTYATYNKDIPFAPTFRKEVGRGFVFFQSQSAILFFFTQIDEVHPCWNLQGCHTWTVPLNQRDPLGDISLSCLLFLCWIQITETHGWAFGCNLRHCDETYYAPWAHGWWKHRQERCR